MKIYHKEKTKCFLIGGFNYRKIYGYNTIFIDKKNRIKAPHIGIGKELDFKGMFFIMQMKI